MILIDVLVPPIDRIYDFEVDEDIDVESLREKIETLVSKKEKIIFNADGRELFLYRKGDFLKGHLSLAKQGILNGDRLILI